MRKTLGEQVQAFLDANGLRPGDLAVAVQKRGAAAVKRQNIEGLLGGIGSPRYIVELAAAMGTTVETLKAGKYQPGGAPLPEVLEPKAQYLPGFEELSIPVLAQTGSMGPGAESLPSDVVRGRLTVSPQWAQQHVKPTDLKNLRFIHGYGDSMDPTFVDGDILLVDVGVKDPKVDGVYVMEANDRIYIKRVRQRMDGSFEISSDNANVKTVDVLNGDHQVEIHGRVVWCWNGKKM